MLQVRTCACGNKGKLPTLGNFSNASSSPPFPFPLSFPGRNHAQSLGAVVDTLVRTKILQLYIGQGT
eukprot:SAG11_NODE_18554_length_487_cov_2.371134_1_plen_66_part_01